MATCSTRLTHIPTATLAVIPVATPEDIREGILVDTPMKVAKVWFAPCTTTRGSGHTFWCGK